MMKCVETGEVNEMKSLRLQARNVEKTLADSRNHTGILAKFTFPILKFPRLFRPHLLIAPTLHCSHGPSEIARLALTLIQ